MPKKAKKDYRKRRRKFLPKEAPKTHSLMINGAHVVPDEMMVKLRFNVIGGHATSLFQATELNGNNANAVFVGGSGLNAAMGMNEWTAFYSKYQVIGSKLSLDLLVNTDPTQKNPVKVSIVPYTSPASPPISIAQAAEMTYGKTKLLAENQNKTHRMSSYMPTKKILGYHNNIDDVVFTHANTISKVSPVQEWRWGIFTDSLAGTYDINWDGYIDYYIRLFQRKTLSESVTPAA